MEIEKGYGCPDGKENRKVGDGDDKMKPGNENFFFRLIFHKAE